MVKIRMGAIHEIYVWEACIVVSLHEHTEERYTIKAPPTQLEFNKIKPLYDAIMLAYHLKEILSLQIEDEPLKKVKSVGGTEYDLYQIKGVSLKNPEYYTWNPEEEKNR